MSNPTPPQVPGIPTEHLTEKAMESADDMTGYLLEQFKNLQTSVGTVSEEYLQQSTQLPPHLKTDSKNPSVQADILSIASFEEEYKRINEDVIKRKNRCSVSEYINTWLILHCHFEHSGIESIVEFRKERANKSLMYTDRFAIQHPIEIHADNDVNDIVAILPRTYNTSKLVRGNLVHAIDQFISYGDHDRPDVQRAANHALLSATAQSNSIDVNEHQLMQAKTTNEIIKVLEYFNADHPLLKKMKKPEPVHQEQTEKPSEVKKQDPLTVNEIDLSDMGI